MDNETGMSEESSEGTSHMVVTAESTFFDFQQSYDVILRRKRGPLRREKIAQAYDDAFDLIGGVPRLALFAHTDPEAFYKLHARLIPTEAKNQFDGNITIVAAVAPTALDDVNAQNHSPDE